jgi:hypothetical protein
MFLKKIYFCFGLTIQRTGILLIFGSTFSLAGSVITSNNFSAFGELLIVQPTPRIQLQFPYAYLNTDYVTSTTATGGTVTAATNLVSLTTTATSGSNALLTSNHILHYNPGQGCICEFTAIYGTGTANNDQIAGIGNVQDGLFFGYNGTSFGILHRSSSSGSLVNDWIAQASWNVDPMDGTGPSGMNLNHQKGNLYKIQFPWLGFGVINFYIANTNATGWNLVHRIQYPNTQTIATLLNPSMQLYAQNINTAASTANTLRICCMAGMVEGQNNAVNTDVRNSYGMTTATSASNTAVVAVLSIQNQPTFNSVTNQVSVFLDAISIFNSSGSTAYARVDLILNPSATLTPFTLINAATSVVAYSSASPSITDGKLLMSFYSDTSTTVSFDLQRYNISLNPGDVLVAAATRVNGTGSSNMWISLTWKERF